MQICVPHRTQGSEQTVTLTGTQKLLKHPAPPGTLEPCVYHSAWHCCNKQLMSTFLCDADPVRIAKVRVFLKKFMTKSPSKTAQCGKIPHLLSGSSAPSSSASL
jgi:hypothetical protein